MAMTLPPSEGDTGFIGRIPVRNLWLLMLYTSDLYRRLPPDERRDVESNPDEIADLVAEILTENVERRLRQNLTFGYRPREAVLRRVRGRIDVLLLTTGCWTVAWWPAALTN